MRAGFWAGTPTRTHLGRLELPQRNVDGDAPLALRLQLVQHPGVLEGALAHLGGLLLELLDRALVNATAFVDLASEGVGGELKSGGRVAPYLPEANRRKCDGKETQEDWCARCRHTQYERLLYEMAAQRSNADGHNGKR